MEVQKKTAVFIDYESLFWALYNKYGQLPDVKELLARIRKNYKIIQSQAFGDFSKAEMQPERNKLRSTSVDIIDCATMNDHKDFTDFIMLDHIYRTLLEHEDIDVYILVSGDGHFSSVVARLVNYSSKEVGIIGVAGTVSGQLKASATWTEEICPSLDSINDDEMKKRVLSSIRFAEKSGLWPSFARTVEKCATFYKEDQRLVATSLSRMVDEGLIRQEVRTLPTGSDARVLVCDWDKVKERGLYVEEMKVE
ncbi:MAG: NYN domain-containing protein [Methylocystaceae bacterium]